LSVTRSGHAQLFKYQANGTSSKPIKPSLNILVAADAGQKESVQQIPIIRGELVEDAKMLLAYGTISGLTIEKVIPNFSDKVQCLVRTDLRKIKEKKEEIITKVKMADTQKVEYLASGM
jgi:U3 small nucleolar RNA-associated protein 5